MKQVKIPGSGQRVGGFHSLQNGPHWKKKLFQFLHIGV
jgi:hypothetical protein